MKTIVTLDTLKEEVRQAFEVASNICLEEGGNKFIFPSTEASICYLSERMKAVAPHIKFNISADRCIFLAEACVCVEA